MAGIHQEMNWGAGCYGYMGMLMEYRKISPTIVAHSPPAQLNYSLFRFSPIPLSFSLCSLAVFSFSSCHVMALPFSCTTSLKGKIR